MKLLNPSIEILPIGVDIFKRIETIGRVCVRSEDKITDESAIKFCRDRLKSGHTAIFNHGIVYFVVNNVIKNIHLFRLLAEFPHIKITYTNNYYIAVPYRCYLDYKNCIKSTDLLYIDRDDTDKNDTLEYHNILNHLFDRTVFSNLVGMLNTDSTDFQSISEKEAYGICPDIVHISVKFTTDRGITHELIRHTAAAFMQESTRTCNYTNDKFGNEINYIEPFWVESVDQDETIIDTRFKQTLRRLEKVYFDFISNGWTPQQARSVLPNTLKSDIWVTTTLKEWYGATIKCTVGNISYEERKGLFPQRLHKTAHLQMIEIMKMVKLELDKLGYGR